MRPVSPLLPSLLLAAAAASAAACTADDGDVESVSGTMIGSIELGDDHIVRFYELEPGVVAIRESASLDLPFEPVDLGALRGKTLEAAYLAIAPLDRADRGDLEALRAADLRVEAHRAGTARTAEARRDDVLTRPADLPAHAGSGVAESPDYFNDNYGEDWFLDRYCVQGGWRYCPTNVAWAQSGNIDDDWYKTCLMTADFEQGVYFQGQHHSWWNWHDDFTFHMRPRRVECWYYGSSGMRRSWGTGDAPNQRIHFSALH